MHDFLALGISPILNEKLKEYGLTEPTPIQEKAIPELLAGMDVIAQAQTGTGKTLAFLLPILEKIDVSKGYVQGLIVTPTRELALQITSEINKIKADEVKVLAVYGGQDVERQLHKLKKDIHIVVCTPGRLLDHLRRETVDLQQVSMVVLDEADQMLHIGFQKDVEDILHQTSDTRQTMLFSATISEQVQALSKKYLNQPTIIRVKDKQVTVKEIKQVIYEVTDREKQNTLCKIIDEQRPYLAVIFCRTKRRANILNEALVNRGYHSEELHGDLSQAKREKVMNRFRKADLQFLVATDVAARGLDVEGVTHVFNYDIPQDVDSYIHRIGRTGRAGGAGVAITLAAPKDREFLSMIEKGIGMKIEKKQIEGSSYNIVAGRSDEKSERPARKRTRSGSTKGIGRNDRDRSGKNRDDSRSGRGQDPRSREKVREGEARNQRVGESGRRNRNTNGPARENRETDRRNLTDSGTRAIRESRVRENGERGRREAGGFADRGNRMTGKRTADDSVVRGNRESDKRTSTRGSGSDSIRSEGSAGRDRMNRERRESSRQEGRDSVRGPRAGRTSEGRREKRGPSNETGSRATRETGRKTISKRRDR